MSHFQSYRFEDLEEKSLDERQFARKEDERSDGIAYQNKSAEFEQNPVDLMKQNLLKQGILVQDLTESNPTKCGLYFPKEIIATSLAHEWNSIYEPSAGGSLIAKEAVVKYYQDRFPLDKEFYNKDDFFLVASTSEAYSYILKSITNPHDSILIPNPGYPLLEHLARWELVETIPYESLEEIPDLVTETTKAILIVQPNNPTGKILSQEEIRLLKSIASKLNLAILIDEVFADYIAWCKSSQYNFVKSSEVPIFTLNGLSKICLLPSAKLSWIHLQAPNSMKETLKNRLEWLADTYLSVNGFAETVLPNVLDARKLIQNQLINRMKRNYGKLLEIIDGQFLQWTLPDGGWYVILETQISNDFEDDFCLSLLKKHHKSIQSGILYGIKSPNIVLVLSMIQKEEEFTEGLLSLKELILEFNNLNPK
ncbi:MAG: pyridoxal phosphate-dependent aminotransferase [Leptospiraceae bacterium]|nr:pyridoxal phosphate-dependent aminotransferase [Leptospiraceae bacterium]